VAAAQSAAPQRVLRLAFQIAETGFDPAQISDTYSRAVTASFFDAPLEYEFLARPLRMRPNTAAAMPEVSADFTTYTFRIQPGIHFADDPAFKGLRRELVAEDCVYSIKRHYDPRWKSANLYVFENAKVLGLSELRQTLLAEKKPFDYDTPVAGLRALDRCTFQVRLAQGDPRFLYQMVDGSLSGALAREVVEFYGDRITEHPVGTGPFVLKSWKRSSRMVLARNLAKRGIQMVRFVRPDVAMSYFAMENPVVGGFDPAFKSDMSQYNLGRAKALLDLHGLCRPQCRRLARTARRPAVDHRIRHQPRPAKPPTRRTVAAQHDRAGRAHGIQDRQVAREPEEQPRRQADDVGRGLERQHARWRRLSRPGLRPQHRRRQPCALQPAGLQRAVGTAKAPARRA